MPYEVGSQVWVLSEGSPWWPAKVLIPETFNVEMPVDKDTFIQYYESGEFDFFSSADTDKICAFELESEKKNEGAVAKAVQEAIADDTAVGNMAAAAAAPAAVAAETPAETQQYGRYTVDHKVWVIRGDKNSSWWPAKVVETHAPVAGNDTVVKFYPLEDAGSMTVEMNSGNADMIVPFETRSEKAATGDAEKKAAVEAAAEDATGFEPAFEVTAPAAATGSKRNRDADLGASKKMKKEKPAQKATQAKPKKNEVKAPAPPKVETERSMPDSALLTHRNKLKEAIENGNIPRVRKLLLDLVEVRVDFSQLQHTKIGVEVGNLMRHRDLIKLHPLASALINKWAGELPAETKDALAQHMNTKKDGNAANATQNRPAAEPTQDAFASHKGFLETLIECLTRSENLSTSGVSRDDAEYIAQEIDNTCVGPLAKSTRKTILTQLRKDDHDALRVKILKREVLAAELVKFNPDDFRTEKEIAEEKAKMDALIALRDETEKSMYVPTTMFECPKCGENECIFHEQQTRGADEPTTKFVRCLKCGNNWTCE